MDAQTLTNLKSEITALKVCEDLQSYKNQVLSLMNAEHVIVAAKVADILLLTDPATFVVASVALNLIELGKMETAEAAVVADIAAVTALLTNQSTKIQLCTLT